MRRKKLISIMLSTMMVMSLAMGCSSKKETTSNSGGNKEKEVTLTMLVGNDATLAGTEAVIALAEEKLGITVEIENVVGGAEGDNIIKTRLASGDMPDILVYNSGAKLMTMNPTEYFTDYSGEKFVERLDDTFKKTVSVNEKTFGIPQASAQAGAVLYNKKLYEKYDLKVPTTWDEFLSNCEVLKEKKETALIGTFGDSWTTQLLYLGDNYNVLAKEPNFATDFEAGKAKYATSPAGLESFSKLADTKGLYNEDYMVATYEEGCDKLANGEGAHWIMLTQALSNIYELYGDKVDDIGVFPIPSDTADINGLTVWMPLSLYGYKNSDKQEDIKKFFELYVSDEGLEAYTKAVLPDGPYCIKGFELPENAYKAVAEDMQPYFDEGKTQVALEFLTPIKGASLEQICQEVVSDQITAKEAAKAYDDDCLKQAVQLGLDWK